MSDLLYRPAAPADVPAIVALVESAYRGQQSRAGWTHEADLLDGQRTDAESVAALLSDPDSALLLAHQGSELVSCCHLQRQEKYAYFGMFAVRPVLQGAGLGKQVIAAAERWVVDNWGLGEMRMTVISVRLELIEWYERRGYVRTGQTSPFPYGDERFGVPKRGDLEFEVLRKDLDAIT
jgi:GNAT superfamily N-acetyltransferase